MRIATTALGVVALLLSAAGVIGVAAQAQPTPTPNAANAPAPAFTVTTPTASSSAPAPARAEARAVKITVLSTMLAGNPMFKGIGEWGFAALVEVDGRRILFDTGLRPQTVLHNAKELGLDLSEITDVILSHHHNDHIGGLVTLRRAFMEKNPASLTRVHVGRGVFWSRGPGDDGAPEENGAIALKAAYEKLGGTFIEHDAPVELAPGVWLTGPIARAFPEKNFGGVGIVRGPAGEVEDTVPEDTALVINTSSGLIVLTGCGHAGAINTLTYARRAIRDTAIHMALGGFHLLTNTDEQLAWTSEKFRELQVEQVLAAHCTGLEATYRLREKGGFTRQTAVAAAVGATFELGKGLDPLVLAR